MPSRRRCLATLAGLAGSVGLAATLPGGLGAGLPAAHAGSAPRDAASQPQGAPATIAVIYGRSRAGKLDKGFNQSAFEGIQAARETLGVRVLEYEPLEMQDETIMITQAAGLADLVITIGYGLHTEARSAANASPQTRFTVVDAVVDHPRFQSMVFREQEGTFLAGLLGALTSRAGVLGFVGGMPSPVISRFLWGYRAGARHVRADITVLDRVLGVTGEAFHDPFKGLLAAEALIEAGADVVFAAAGRSGLGVYQAAANHGVLAIGVDANQNFLHPGTMLTSMVKRVDTAVLLTIREFVENRWAAGTRSLGLAEDGVGLALDHYNQPLIPAAHWERVIAARKALIAGDLRVPLPPGQTKQAG